MTLVVDGMNVIGTVPDGWWRDRPRARRALVARLAALAADGGPVVVVFDGRPTADEVEVAARVGVTARFAPGGPDAADAAIAAMVEGELAGTDVTVVTSDRALAARVSAAGAATESASSLLARLGPPAGPGG